MGVGAPISRAPATAESPEDGTTAPVRLLAQRYHRAGTFLYAVAVPLHELHRCLPIPDPDRPFAGNRRVSAARARDFAEYWSTNRRWVSPPLLVDTPRTFADVFTPVAGNGELTAGVLELAEPPASGIEILDGQHRVLGWYLLLRELREKERMLRRAIERTATRDDAAALHEARRQLTRMREESVTVEILEGVALDEHKQYFFDIAANALGISKSVSAGFDKRDVLNRVAQTLAREHPLLSGRVDLENDRVGRGGRALMSLRHVVDLVTAATLGVTGWFTRSHARTLTQERAFDVAEQALDALVGSFDELNDLAESVITPAQLREDSLLGSITVLRALAAAYHAIAVRDSVVEPEGDRRARRAFERLARETGFPVGDLWWSSRAFAGRESRAPRARRQDLEALVDLVVRVSEMDAGADLPPTPVVEQPRTVAVPEPVCAASDEDGFELRWSGDQDEPTPRLDGRGPTADVVQDLARVIGRYRLLSAADEVRLAQQIEAGVLADERLSTGSETRRERRELEHLVHEGKEAFDQMVTANMRLVVSIVRRYTGHGLDLADLIQEGTLGLMRAVQKFDHRAGFKFSTYATWWVRQAVSRALADQSRTIRLPVHVVERLNRVRREQADARMRLGREPSLDELAAALDEDVDALAELLTHDRAVLSLDEPVTAAPDERPDAAWDGQRWTVPFGHLIEDADAPDPYEAAHRAMLAQDVSMVLDTLTEREAGILTLRFGLDGGDPKTLDEIGVVYGVTRERIRQIEKATLTRLRSPEYVTALADYLGLPTWWQPDDAAAPGDSR